MVQSKQITFNGNTCRYSSQVKKSEIYVIHTIGAKYLANITI